MRFDPNQPIYLQLVEEFTRLIVTGQWPPGQKTPSVRTLAADLGVNPNTVQKALGELDRAGLTGSERTAGRTVNATGQQVREAGKKLARASTSEYLEKMRGLGLELEDVLALVAQQWEQKHTGNGKGKDGHEQ